MHQQVIAATTAIMLGVATTTTGTVAQVVHSAPPVSVNSQSYLAVCRVSVTGDRDLTCNAWQHGRDRWDWRGRSFHQSTVLRGSLLSTG
jgi:hypothetical protein